MNSTVFHASPIKDGRRILGEKTVNACLSPRHVSPVKHALLDPSSPRKQLLPSPSFVGQKRSIDRVEREVSGDQSRVSVYHGAATVQTAGRPSSSSRKHTDTLMHSPVRATASQKFNPQSQEPKQLTQSHKSEDTSDPSLESGPMTCIIPDDPDTRKLFIQRKAILLRNRIQSAMRRVQDPQFDRRLSELEAHRRKLPRLSLPEASTLKPQDKETIASPSSTPRALPPSRAPNQPSESTAPVSGLSSPPSSVGNAHSQDDPMKTPTQTSHRRTYTAGSPMQLSSPPATVSRRDECLRTPTAAADASPQDDSATDKRLVTPAQRGDAVDGLLKLMNTGEKCKDSSPWTGSANSG